MALLLKNAHVIDPQVGLNETADILVRDGKIVEIGQNLAMEKGVERDLGGKIVIPGLVDIHVHLREPGDVYKRQPLGPLGSQGNRFRRERDREEGLREPLLRGCRGGSCPRCV